MTVKGGRGTMVGDKMIQLQHRVNYGLVVFPWFALRCVGSGSVLWVERRIEMPLEGGEIGKGG